MINAIKTEVSQPMASQNKKDASKKRKITYSQSGVIAFRWRQDELRILLITNRKRTHWVIPKGLIELDLSALQSAEKEAFEEAGIRGLIFDGCLGTYRYKKWGGFCDVEVFPMKVEKLVDTWPEMAFRNREWVLPDEAINRVREPGLKHIIESFKHIAMIYQ